ncbi:MAG: 30S ribosomal protein S17e [archaeon]|nr:MAG: 30S ribosomal protein S17e [archaeon]
MGRIKSTAIKRKARKLVEEKPEVFDKDFEKTKKILKDIMGSDKKTRNKIAGYVTRLKKKC